MHAIRNNLPDTGYSRLILDTGHAYGNVENIMKIIKKPERENSWIVLRNTIYS
jgi:hypothetical protein